MSKQLSLQALESTVRKSALRWLHSINWDSHSQTHGYADREYWSWKFKDFNNGTWQGGVAGFLDAADTLSFQEGECAAIVATVLRGTLHSQRSNGSFEEAYPYESSYCVTALVLFDLLTAYYGHKGKFTEQSTAVLKKIVENGDRYLRATPETHGLIANHLVTGYLAEHLSSQFLHGCPDPALCSKVTALFRDGGWFPEYGGADPGYQTLLNHYLNAAHQALPMDPAVTKIFEKSVHFCEAFMFPDGSYSGEIGSRGTSMVYPSGIVTESSNSAIQWFLERHLGSLNCVEPVMIDAGNFVPMFNSWALCWRMLKNRSIPALAQEHKEVRMSAPGSGLVALQTTSSCLAFSLVNGSFRSLLLKDGKWIDESIVAFTRGEFSTQLGLARVTSNGEGRWKLELQASRRSEMQNSALKSIVIRIVAILFYRFPLGQRLWKASMAFILMRFRPNSMETGILLEIDWHRDHAIHVEVRDKAWVARRLGFHSYMASANSMTARAFGN